MPAITPSEISAVPALRTPRPADRARPVRSVTTSRPGWEGEGFPVRRAFHGLDPATVDPFVLMDQMGEVHYAPGEPKGTPWHPHRGFETVTYMIDGETVHRDSHGGGGVIGSGDTQWMTAGSGILHIERPSERLISSGGLFHGVQLWVNLPAAQKAVPPRYQDIRAGEVPLVRSPDGGALLRVIAGEIDGHRGPGTTRTPIALVHATLAAGASLTVPWPRGYNALAYALAGGGTVGAEHRPLDTGQLAVLGHGDVVQVSADLRQTGPSPTLELLLLGGRPIGERVVHHGPFVMNTEAEISQAIEDFHRGRLGRIPADHVDVGPPTVLADRPVPGAVR